MTHVLYSAAPLDRAHHLRQDDKAQAKLLADPAKRVVPYWREMSLIAPQGAVFATGTPGAEYLDMAEQVVFLGIAADGHPVFAADLSHLEPEQDGTGPNLALGGQWIGLRMVAPTMPDGDSSLLGYARAMLLWHRRHRFCGCCGAPTDSREGGHVRQCVASTCNTPHYPRTDPVVIMLVSDGDKVLLHRQRPWPLGQWSILAGFVEPGETLEQAVAREVMEETGVRVEDVTYVANQPWPYPGSLTVGFTARYTGGDLRPDPHELEDAAWFSRQTILTEFDDSHRGKGTGLCLPPIGSISRALVERWLGR